MAAKEPRHPLEKRELLHREPPDTARIDGVASALLDAGRFGEALDYVEVTRNAKLIERIEAESVKRGSAFLLQAVERLRGTKADTARWTEVATSALANERYVDAVRAYASLGDEARAEEIRVRHCPDYEPFKPLGK